MQTNQKRGGEVETTDISIYQAVVTLINVRMCLPLLQYKFYSNLQQDKKEKKL